MVWEIAGLEIAAGVMLALLVGGPLWVGDGARREADRAALASAMAGRDVAAAEAEAPAAFARAFDRLLGPRPGALLFILKSVGVSMATGAVLLATFMVLNPVFLQSVLSDSYQRGAVFGQFLKVIVVVNLAVDYICLVWCREVVGRMRRRWSPARLPLFLVQDVGVKALVMLVAMVFVFSGIAGQNGPVGRQQLAVFGSLPHVLLDGVTFGNLSAIYIWSCFISSAWLWGWFLAVPVLTRLAPRLTLSRAPMRTAAATLGLVTAVVYWLAVWLAG